MAQADGDIGKIDDILSRIETALEEDEDEGKIPEDGIEYLKSVSEKLEGIKDTIERTFRVSPKQHNSIKNMIRGAENWLSRRDKEDD